MMCHYPGNILGDPEDKAAAGNMLWLGDRAGNDQVVICDIHNANYDSRFCGVGPRALKSSLAVAYLLDFRMCVVVASAFHEAIPNCVSLEIPTYDDRNDGEIQEKAEELFRNLSTISQVTHDELHDLYDEILPQLTFLCQYEIAIEPIPGDDVILVVTDPDLLAGLEAIVPVSGLSKFSLDSRLRQALGISEGQLYMEYWAYNNMSPELPDRGEFNGQPRKLALGSLFVEIEPPIVTQGKWVEFTLPPNRQTGSSTQHNESHSQF